MPRVAFLTLENAADFVIDDSLAIDELTRRGWDAAQIPWTRPDVDWGAFDLVLIRTTWDYMDRVKEFLATLAQIDASGTRLENSRDIVEWNIDKQYLRTLERRGVTIVPSVWGHGGDARTFAALFVTLQETEIVVKPTISGGAMDTFRLHAPLSDVTLQHLVDTFADRDWFAQPFLRTVITEGEYSLFYFAGQLSHAIQKVPKAGDFRVQEEHGGEISAIAVTPELRKMADSVIATLDPVPFQARIDLVRLDNGKLAVMEVELIEPSLYFRMDERTPANFADALERLLALPATKAAQ
jgi:glutathione synthase/RimK-type ligase-like ATP-grasp enzyme